MTITITIQCDNAAFDDGHAGAEVARILRKLAARVDGDSLSDYCGSSLHDINGNKVGAVDVEDGR